jgi:hypothetical protein
LFRNGTGEYTNRLYRERISAVDATGSASLVIASSASANSDYTLLTDMVSVSSVGNLGVGTTAPAYKVDVAGDINFTGTLRSNGTAFNPVVSYPSG